MKVLVAFGSLAALLFVAACSNGQLPSSALWPSASNAQENPALARISLQQFLAKTQPGYASSPTHRDHRKSWMSPAAKSIEALLYASDAGTDDVEVYDYTNGKQVGTLTGFDSPAGQCVDAKGDVYIANYENGEIVEYARGGSSPLNTFSTNGYAIGCAVDSKGDLAATDFEYFSSADAGAICVWKGGKGSSTCYQNSSYCTFLWPAGYDDKGNLIAIGYSYQYESTEVCGLLSGATSMERVSFDEPLYFFYGGGTMWDGQYLALSNWEGNLEYEPAVYQTTLSGSTLTEVRETDLSDTPCNDKTDIQLPFVVGRKNTPVNREQGKTIIGSNADCSGSSAGIGVWHYPKGGNPYKSYELGFASSGQSVSVAPPTPKVHLRNRR
jgi:hypothetical protein